ncbi:MAG: DUF6632 domain-containing protein [Thermoanaerobaculia bacterium]
MIYPLWVDLRDAHWLLVLQNETEPMFLSFFIPLGVFLVLAARKPLAYRMLILFAAWQSVAHASVMLIETVEARIHDEREIHALHQMHGDRWRATMHHEGASIARSEFKL